MSTPRDAGFRLDELAERAGISPRTVRYYVQRGLLAAPVFRGRDTAYDAGHLLRLRAIKRLQEQHLPLDEIAVVLAHSDEATLESLAQHGLRRQASAPSRVEVERINVTPEVSRMRGRVAVHGGVRGTRWQLAPGVELWVDETIDGRDLALVEKLRAVAEKHRAGG